MAQCKSCGVAVPEGQDVCSVCYGDVEFGNDGHYRRLMEEWAEDAARRANERDWFPEQLDVKEAEGDE